MKPAYQVDSAFPLRGTVKWVSVFGLSMVGVGSGSLYRRTHSLVVLGRRPLGAVLHSSNVNLISIKTIIIIMELRIWARWKGVVIRG